MGKRSHFERRERDYYPTPAAAVPPLIPHLRLHGVRTFAEPCCGDGALVPHLMTCSDIVVVGRLRWIDGTTMAGKENFGWFRFDARHTGGPILHPHQAPPSRGARACAQCGEPYRPQRSDSRFCSDGCRQRAYRERRAATQA
jgi:hypothetical protein